jgi:toxin YoeB
LALIGGWRRAGDGPGWLAPRGPGQRLSRDLLVDLQQRGESALRRVVRSYAAHQILKRINRLIDDALRDPTDGIGKPEPLMHMLAGTWSRRITDEHRLVYLVDDEDLVILQARFHYK